MIRLGIPPKVINATVRGLLYHNPSMYVLSKKFKWFLNKPIYGT